MRVVKYDIPLLGLGTESSPDSQPLEYATQYTNRFRNYYGQAEKRQGLKQIGSQISGTPVLTAIHEWVEPSTNVATQYVSGGGQIWKYNTGTSTWDSVLTGKDSSAVMFSVQMDGKLIFVNGVDRNFFTDDNGVTFKELKALIIKGETATGTDTVTVKDANIDNFVTQTLVSTNDLVFNADVSAYAVVTSVGATALSHTVIGVSGTGIGVAGSNPTNGQAYEVVDLIELNVVPTKVGSDNVALAASGTSSTVIKVSALDFDGTEIRAGDFIRNTTKAAVTRVESVSASALNVVSVSGQASGDSLVFLKSAMPIADYPHVHFGRLYLIDSRDATRVRISGPDDPQDFTTFTQTLQSSSVDYGSRQPQGDVLLTLDTFQRYLVAAGKQTVYVDDGQTPIQDTTAAVTDLEPIGVFPQGCVSRFGLASIGNNALYVGQDGLRQFRSGVDFRTTNTDNASEQIKSELVSLIQSQTDEDKVQLIHYRRRNWAMLKVGNSIYNYNYTPLYRNGAVVQAPSWSKFTGKFAEQNAYKVLQDGTMFTCDSNGNVYQFDQDVYDDAGDNIVTKFEFPWVFLSPQDGVNVIDSRYVKPVFDTTQVITYTISGESDFEGLGSDSVITTAKGAGVVGLAVVGSSPVGGQRTTDDKLPMRLRGEEIRIKIETDDTKGPDTITKIYLYGNEYGKD